MEYEKIVLNEERNVSLTIYIQGVGGEYRGVEKRPAVMVIPGGGYHICSDRESEGVAFTFLKAGFDAFVLRYSLGGDAAWPNPLNDYEQAMEYVRNHAQEWNIYEDKIAVCGFSAGGHLACAAATVAKNKPNAAILGYPVVSDLVKYCVANAPELISAVDEKTCPCFIMATRTDERVPITDSIRLIERLAECGVPFESHIYGWGPHGFGSCEQAYMMREQPFCRRIPGWTGDAVDWLRETFDIFQWGSNE